MTDCPPLLCEWTGEAFAPLGPRAQKTANEHFVVGERYRIAEHQERSNASHSHEFAWLHEAWKNLPERFADMFPSSEHLRKRALIEAGFYNEMVIDAGTKAAAIRVAAGFRSHDEFCVAVVSGPIVAVRTAKSQSRRAMDKAEFARSKQAIMEIVSDMLGVDADTLQKNTARAA